VTAGPLALALAIAAMLDELRIPYALGGSLALSFLGEPRTTIDVDMAVNLDREALAGLLNLAESRFYIPRSAAFEAVERHTSFNLIDTNSALKVDLFVLGAGLLDRAQISRRIRRIVQRDPRAELWVTSAEVMILRKLEWRRLGGGLSDRQWRDVVSILAVQHDALDHRYLHDTARLLGLDDDLRRAEADAAG
jgi:hypothetical protein